MNFKSHVMGASAHAALFLLATCLLAAAAHGQPQGAENAQPKGTAMFNILDYGAKTDGVTLNTKAIQSAIDACGAAGGGVVLFPPGTYLSGTIELRDNVTLRLEANATLLGSKDIEDYPLKSDEQINLSFSTDCLVYGYGVSNAGIEGKGVIDGQGTIYGGTGMPSEGDRRPRLLYLMRCANLTLRDVTFKNAGLWAVHLVACDNLRIEGITVDSWMYYCNDALDIDSCQDVFISNCNLSSEDDVIALKNTLERPCRNIVITNCIMSSRCAALRFGPESLGGFENITVSNCVIRDTYMCGIKLQMVEGGRMENITFSNLVMDNVTGPISIRLGRWERTESWSRTEDGKVREPGTLRNVLISNVRARVPASFSVPGRPDLGSTEVECKSPISISGIPGHMIEGITLDNIHITYPGGGTRAEGDRREIPEAENAYPEFNMFGLLPAYGLYIRHARGIVLRNVRLELEKPDGRPAMVCDDAQNLEIAGLRAESSPEAESLLRLHNSRDVWIHDCRPEDEVETFLQVEGEHSSGISLIDNDLRRASRAVQLTAGAPDDAVSEIK